MATRFKNRLLVTSLALAAAGILTCAAAVLDVYLPRASLGAFAGWLITAGIAIAAVMAGFAWTCDKVDDRNRSRKPAAAHYGNEWPRAVTSARGGHPAVLIDRPARPAGPPVSPRWQNFPITLRGAMPPVTFRDLRLGHGQ